MSKDILADKIIDEAAKIFTKYGFKKTTMDDIAGSLGKGKSSIYYYFTSKEEIFQAVVEKEANELRSEVKDAISQQTDSIIKIKTYVITRTGAYKRFRNFYNAVTNDDLIHLDFISVLRSRFEKEEIVLVEQILNLGVQAGTFKLTDTHHASIAIVTSLKGLEESLGANENNQTVETRLDNLLNILFYGIIIR